ncbi:PLD nuclease N-terminal domain-containing protein [Rhodococcus globerulus]|uniref:PLD nuclease N-terminal domain-containing protein n=1 Tax=Rhodococcus globerulus TaxID=33008 RepID=UPI001586C97B|nr:PLD nuclease N-terminal domain-containing protein [Rhodococcus globerulus]
MNEETHNPTVPIGFDIAWSVFMILWIVLTAAALVSIVRSDADRIAKIGWSAFAVILPIVGPAAWFFASRRRQNAL